MVLASSSASGPVTVETDGHSWATELASRVPVPARAADGPLTFRPADRARVRADAWEGEGNRQYPGAPARAGALSESVPDGQRAVSTPAHQAAPTVSHAPPQSVPRGSLAVSTPSSGPRQALVARRSRQYPMAGPDRTRTQLGPVPSGSE